MSDWYSIEVSKKQVSAEREKARQLRYSAWWKQKLQDGLCHYCGGRFEAAELTMDHIVPIARGGKSSQGNIVPSCKDCNSKKKLSTPVEMLLEKLKNS